ncbi:MULTISPECIES: HepT-like ribonuclease domain-containing protein [Nitrospirillum]|uniref:Uncharacterized protein with HEPN domain n=1 Tax=Nitrospirillum amazonense TaxID=28077 RepID=A0A560EWZ5_9PROT|nr:HepT-like ribonuclease domain-containing protein [Nitrospirillum amazonense]MEC4592762.1 HepT-like ribonuclease domain-containing protein [Nitrospirillum amazonense]TWB13897.1 uncharacterized protein with HEPN domain [Nitrospirillum amazonense]
MSFKAGDSARWLEDILGRIALAEQFVAGRPYHAFADDVQTVYAVIRCLEIISEASRRLPEGMKASHPEIPWKQIAGAGNIYRHDYEEVAASLVWKTLQVDLPILKAFAEQELAALSR